MAEGRLTLHHLNNSQSMKVLWLLEELEIDYDLKLYERYKSGPRQAHAPDELKQVHPLGKSPTIVTTDGRAIAESEAIMNYLIKTYDTKKQFQGDPTTGNDDIRNDVLTNLAQTSLNIAMMVDTMFQIVALKSPFFLRPLFNAVYSKVRLAYTKDDLATNFKFLERELGEQAYFMGSNPGRADFMLQWPFDSCVAWNLVNLKDYPKLDQWYTRCQAREGWKRARSKGNAYDPAFAKH